MVLKILRGRVFILFFCMFILGFFVGYDYALVTANQNDVKQKEANEKYEMGKMNETGLTDYSGEDIMDKN